MHPRARWDLSPSWRIPPPFLLSFLSPTSHHHDKGRFGSGTAATRCRGLPGRCEPAVGVRTPLLESPNAFSILAQFYPSPPTCWPRCPALSYCLSCTACYLPPALRAPRHPEVAVDRRCPHNWRCPHRMKPFRPPNPHPTLSASHCTYSPPHPTLSGSHCTHPSTPTASNLSGSHCPPTRIQPYPHCTARTFRCNQPYPHRTCTYLPPHSTLFGSHCNNPPPHPTLSGSYCTYPPLLNRTARTPRSHSTLSGSHCDPSPPNRIQLIRIASHRSARTRPPTASNLSVSHCKIPHAISGSRCYRYGNPGDVPATLGEASTQLHCSSLRVCLNTPAAWWWSSPKSHPGMCDRAWGGFAIHAPRRALPAYPDIGLDVHLPPMQNPHAGPRDIRNVLLAASPPLTSTRLR